MKSRVLWLGIVLSFSLTALAQDTASITGTVTDPSGAAVSGAQVTLTSPDRGFNRTSPTNESGDFLFGSVPGGSYDLVVVGAGFKKYQAKGVKLAVGQKARADVALQVGAANTTVEVEGVTVAQVETQSSDLSGTVTGKEITQLELNGRNFTQLATLVPGVSNQSGQDDASVGVGGNVSFSMNGGRTEYNNWELDSGDNMDNGSNTTLNVYPSLEAIAEFKVLTSNYGAQYGRNGSGTVEVETKSGTRSFHGDAYEFVRNDIFNANTLPPEQRASVQEERLRIHHRRSGLYSRALQQGPKQDFLLLVAGVAAGPGSGKSGQRDRSVAGRTGRRFQRCLPRNAIVRTDSGRSRTGLPFPGNIVPVDPNAPAPMLADSRAQPGINTWNAAPDTAHQLARRTDSRGPQF